LCEFENGCDHYFDDAYDDNSDEIMIVIIAAFVSTGNIRKSSVTREIVATFTDQHTNDFNALVKNVTGNFKPITLLIERLLQSMMHYWGK
jgi:hypothetical protein